MRQFRPARGVWGWERLLALFARGAAGRAVAGAMAYFPSLCRVSAPRQFDASSTSSSTCPKHAQLLPLGRVARRFILPTDEPLPRTWHSFTTAGDAHSPATTRPGLPPQSVILNDKRCCCCSQQELKSQARRWMQIRSDRDSRGLSSAYKGLPRYAVAVVR